MSDNNHEPIKPGIQTSEFKVTAGAGIALLIPIIQTVLTRFGDTTVDKICLTVIVVTFILARAFAKR